MSSSPSWQFTLFGTPTLRRPDGADAPCERKALALMAFLAVEGATSRARLASLLWPDTPSSAARNNLVHHLRRQTRTYGAPLVVGADVLELAAYVTTDVRRWTHEDATTSQADHADVPDEVFLKDVTFDEMLELDEWALASRERFHALHVTHLIRAAQAHEDAGDLLDATRLTERLVTLDNLSEDAWRRLMRLHYLRGDRPAALRAYHRCKEVLSRELGLEPLPETVRLAHDIDRGERHAPTPGTPARLPLAV
ncbi:AfsR/SARP family transcriptional regulator, partial [Deinococcus pimensis]|uniref:AfsR/SARP family transcriptional regulator n=1 Tax=Deinococcus pimensis TaxID=309888 RepID=UPI0005EBCFF5